MKNNGKFPLNSEGGAAMMTVLVATLLLGTACIALLSAVGASSQNNTDALSEAKAYWAAESGLQATINVLRNGNVNYNQALANPNLAYDATTFPSGLGYGADNRVTMNSEAAYAVTVSNPDATLPYAFHTTTSFNSTTATGVTLENGASPNPRICFPNCTATDRTIVSLVGNPNATNSGYPLLGTFAVEKVGVGYAIPDGVTFRIEFVMTSPRAASRTIRGKIPAADANQNVSITFDSQVAEIVGSEIELCNSQTPSAPPAGEGACPNFSLSLASGQSASVYATVGPVEPYRLLVTSNGYGPNSSQKKLEGVIIKDLLNGLPTTSALTMVGPGASLQFQPGNGTPTYCGVDPGIEDGEEIPNNNALDCELDPNSPTAPAIGVSDQTALNNVNASLGNTEVIPAPDILTDGPVWLQSATAYHNYINELRTRAQTSGLYIPDTNGANNATSMDSYAIGSYSAGSGITFCEGNCTIGPREGGGILVVNGNFEYSGNYDHRGTIIVVGNMHRNGAGNGIILGSVIIADYDPNNLNGGFLSPRFTSNGSGTSDIIYNGAASAFDGTASVTNLMIGVAEK